ncbi:MULTISPECIES: N-carbamoyl-L-amino acid amidohydrolase [unclassified Sphingopyxis]|jgi:hypothetical protein|uniref:N-carbamoyl-L-amino acid amidohydrolase n=1 Tax=unclassified Sphingopyxis TaxID=2614943 RepID=UPI00128BEB04|nr:MULTISPECIES: N-carbamoyl-L-amino acid amidohydrolase [unclassified Sphingopyxis]USI75532.1 hypothetical protein KEC45_12150 [Sphingopyxis sp. USTB-05]
MANPYLSDGRLNDVIAAITVLGTYKFYKLSTEKWAARISGSTNEVEKWRIVFREHPEFFRAASEADKISLVWRRQFPRNFDVDAEPEYLPDDGIDETKESRISRRPLTPSEVTELVSVAIRLHDRALEQQKAGKWWTQLVVAGMTLLGVALGAVLQHYLRNDSHSQGGVPSSISVEVSSGVEPTG